MINAADLRALVLPLMSALDYVHETALMALAEGDVETQHAALQRIVGAATEAIDAHEDAVMDGALEDEDREPDGDATDYARWHAKHWRTRRERVEP